MPRGYPDWDKIKKPGAVSALADLGALESEESVAKPRSYGFIM